MHILEQWGACFHLSGYREDIAKGLSYNSPPWHPHVGFQSSPYSEGINKQQDDIVLDS